MDGELIWSPHLKRLCILNVRSGLRQCWRDYGVPSPCWEINAWKRLAEVDQIHSHLVCGLEKKAHYGFPWLTLKYSSSVCLPACKFPFQCVWSMPRVHIFLSGHHWPNALGATKDFFFFGLGPDMLQIHLVMAGKGEVSTEIRSLIVCDCVRVCMIISAYSNFEFM